MHLAPTITEPATFDWPAPTCPARRILIVTPHFPPSNVPDHQRVRMALPFLAAEGWQAEVLAVAPEFVDAPLDPGLAAAVPFGIPIHRVAAIPLSWTRRVGWGSLARRSYRSLREHGARLLAGGNFDLVFFSTSQFGVLPLGLEWKRRFGVPYMLDFHDEWVSDYYRRHRKVVPPGGRIKYGLSRAFAAWQEGPVVRQAAQIVAVSERYTVNLRRRHPGLDPSHLHVLPFGGAADDFASAVLAPQPFFRARGEELNWVYVGRGGPAMHRAAAAFFQAARRALDAGLIPATWRLHCLGTAYATGARARETFAPLAAAAGMAAFVRERTARVPHFTALRCLREADALIVFGSDDPGYTASKIVPYLFARRPLLGIFHESSSGGPLLRETGAGVAVTFKTGDQTETLADRIFEAWFALRQFAHTPEVASAALTPYTAEAMTRRLVAIFKAACTIGRSGS